jgi:hypothetical protein
MLDESVLDVLDRLPRKHGRLGTRFAWVLPAPGAWMVAVGAGVVHRGLTIPFQGTGPVRTHNPCGAECYCLAASL